MTCTLNLIRDQTINFTQYQTRHAYLDPTESIVLQNGLLYYNNIFIHVTLQQITHYHM